MKTLTEINNGQRVWSYYGLREMIKTKKDYNSFLFSIIIENALSECKGITKLNPRSFYLEPNIYIKIRPDVDQVIISKDTGTQGEEVEITSVSFNRAENLFLEMRKVWNQQASKDRLI